MKIGYIRVSTEEQNTARQEVLLCELDVDEIFIDKASGKNADRPELTRMMNYVRRGDTVIVESISRFARNGQLRASGCSLACRGNHCRRSHAADRAQAQHLLSPVLDKQISCVQTCKIYIM